MKGKGDKQMNTPTFHECYNILRDSMYCVSDIQVPHIQGNSNKVFIVKTPNDDYVCKFNETQNLNKDMAVNQLYHKHGINMPNLQLKSAAGHLFEFYKFIPGRTMFEHLMDDISTESIQKIYANLIAQFIKMSNISKKEIIQICAAHKNIIHIGNKDNNTSLSDFLTDGIYHCDMTPKNIILNDAGEFVSLIDYSKISFVDKHYAFSRMALPYHKMGFDIEDLINAHNNNADKQLKTDKIYTTLNKMCQQDEFVLPKFIHINTR